jgi:hypothetical protein
MMLMPSPVCGISLMLALLHGILIGAVWSSHFTHDAATTSFMRVSGNCLSADSDVGACNTSPALLHRRLLQNQVQHSSLHKTGGLHRG